MSELIAKPTDHAVSVADNHASSSSAYNDAYKDQTLSARTGARSGSSELQPIDLSTSIPGYPGAADSKNEGDKSKEPEKPSIGAEDRSKKPEIPSTSPGSSVNPNPSSALNPNDAASPESAASSSGNAPGLGSSEVAAVARMAGEGILGAGKDLLSAGKSFIDTAEQHPFATAAAVGTTAVMAAGIALVVPEVAAGALLLGGGALAARGIYDLYESASDIKAINSTYTNQNATPEQMQAADAKAQETLGVPILDVASGALSIYGGAAIVSGLRSAAAADLARNEALNERAAAAFRNLNVDGNMYSSGNSSLLPGTGDVENW